MSRSNEVNGTASILTVNQHNSNEIWITVRRAPLEGQIAHQIMKRSNTEADLHVFLINVEKIHLSSESVQLYKEVSKVK